MKLSLLILLAAAALAAAPASGQTIKSLGYNTTNGRIVAATNVVWTNAFNFATNTVAGQVRTNLGLGATNNVTFDSLLLGGTTNTLGVYDFYAPAAKFDDVEIGGYGLGIDENGNLTLSTSLYFNNTTNAAQTRTNLGLGATNAVTFSNITANGIVNAKSATSGTPTNATNTRGIQWSSLSSEHAAIYGTYDGVAKIGLSVGTSNSLSDVATFRSTGMTVASNAIVGGTLAVSNTATFATNVSVAGSLTVGSFTTTTPSTWALDATQTAAATNGVLTLPSNANVLRITNANTISGVSNGILGAFYFLINQSGTNVVISNSATITARGATNITLGTNESATLISTTATNATAH
jgi:hypothetical protein